MLCIGGIDVRSGEAFYVKNSSDIEGKLLSDAVEEKVAAHGVLLLKSWKAQRWV